MGFAAVLASALALSAPGGERAFALLADNRLVELALPSGKVAARWRLGPKLRERVSPGRMLALRGTRVFALVQSGSGTDSIAVVDAQRARVRARYSLEPGVRYRGVLLVGSRLYAFGGRYGRIVATEPVEVREQSAVITTPDVSSGGRWGRRQCETPMAVPGGFCRVRRRRTALESHSAITALARRVPIGSTSRRTAFVAVPRHRPSRLRVASACTE